MLSQLSLVGRITYSFYLSSNKCCLESLMQLLNQSYRFSVVMIFYFCSSYKKCKNTCYYVISFHYRNTCLDMGQELILLSFMLQIIITSTNFCRFLSHCFSGYWSSPQPQFTLQSQCPTVTQSQFYTLQFHLQKPTQPEYEMLP